MPFDVLDPFDGGFDGPLGSSPPSTQRLKRWNGTAWEEKPLMYWNGATFVEKTLKYWNGSTWV